MQTSCRMAQTELKRTPLDCPRWSAVQLKRRRSPPGTSVRLETEVQTHDRYGRSLAYVWLPDGRMVNEILVREGWALVLTIPPNVRHADILLACQREARTAKRGLWGP